MLLLRCAVVFLIIGNSYGFFVPEQLPTLLSFIYTNIPPIRKGTDSKVGLGFRLGQNADFQVMFELGPQQNTRPAGSEASDIDTTPNKRETDITQFRKTPTWLQRLRKKQKIPIDRNIEKTITENTDDYPLLDKDVINHLRQLYKPKTTE